MGKDSVQISASATLLADAHRHIRDPLTMSSAEDAGQPERNAKHFMQHVINSANMELEATQAASIVLDMPSSTGSHGHEYHCAWDAVHLAEVASCNESTTHGLLTMTAEGTEKTESEPAEESMGMDVEEGACDGREEAGEASGHDAAVESEDDDEALLTSAFEQPASEQASRRMWVVAVARRAVERAQRATSEGAAEHARESCSEGEEAAPEDVWADDTADDCDDFGRAADKSASDRPTDDAALAADDTNVVACGPEALDHVEEINLEKHFHTEGVGHEGGSDVYLDEHGGQVILSKMHHYAWRDDRLECFNALEFTATFCVRKMSSQDHEWHRARARRIRLLKVWFYVFLRGLWQGVRESRLDVMRALADATPITLANKPGQRVLVPSSTLPNRPCLEYGGKAWDAVIADEVLGGATRVRIQLLFLLRQDASGEKVTMDVDPAMLRPVRPVLQGMHLCKADVLEPLTLANARGRRVLVPESLWPGYACDEYCEEGQDRGKGWEAVVIRTHSKMRNEETGKVYDGATVEFCYARDDQGRLFHNEKLGLHELIPLRPAPRPCHGRPTMRFVLREPHPLASSHIIVRRAKWGVPALVGNPPPRLSTSDVRETQRRQEAAFARYFVSNLVPWSAWNTPQLTIERWRAHVEELETDACLSCDKHELEKAGNAVGFWSDEPKPDQVGQQPPPGYQQARRKRLVAAARLADIENLTHGFTAPKLASVLLMKHRSRTRTIWNDANPATRRPEGADGEDVTAGQREAINEIKKLREKAERLRGTKSITTRINDACSVKAWADELRKQLPAAADGSTSTTRLHKLWQLASKPSRRTINHRSQVRDPVEVNNENYKPLSVHEEVGRASASHDVSGDVDMPSVGDNPFAPITDKDYDVAAANYEKSKRAGLGVGAAPLNPEQRDGGREFLRVAQLRRAALNRGEPIQRVAQAIERDGITLVVGAGGTGKSAMVHQLHEQFATHNCGKLLITAYTGTQGTPNEPDEQLATNLPCWSPCLVSHAPCLTDRATLARAQASRPHPLVGRRCSRCST